MKKFSMISLITAGVLFALGLGLVIVGGVTGGVRLIVDSSVNGIFSLLDELGGIVNILPEDFIPEDVNVDYNEAYPIFQGGNVSNMQVCARDEVTDITICIMSGDFDIVSSGTDYFGVEWEGTGRFQYYVEDGTLYVLSTENIGDATVYVPEDMVCESYTLAVAAGNVDAEEIRAEEVSLYIGMSDVFIDTLEADSLTLEAGASRVEIWEGSVAGCAVNYNACDIEYNGTFSGDVEMTGSEGNLDLVLWGDSDQFNYFISSAMGNVDIPGYHVVGFAQNKTIDNGAGKDMTLTSSMGNIKIDFTVE